VATEAALASNSFIVFFTMEPVLPLGTGLGAMPVCRRSVSGVERDDSESSDFQIVAPPATSGLVISLR
jgi:hypothetical protein